MHIGGTVVLKDQRKDPDPNKKPLMRAKVRRVRISQEVHPSPPARPLGEGSCEKIGRASLLASYRPSKSLPHEARREPRLPMSAGLNFFTPPG